MLVPAHAMQQHLLRLRQGMAVVGLDVSPHKCGVAVSDRAWSKAFAWETLDLRTTPITNVRAGLQALMSRFGAGGFVVGWPLLPHMDAPGESCEFVAEFLQRLQMPEVPKALVDERYSSVRAENDLWDMHEVPKKVLATNYGRLSVDELAARIILQDFLSEHGPIKRGPQSSS